MGWTIDIVLHSGKRQGRVRHGKAFVNRVSELRLYRHWCKLVKHLAKALAFR